jgi:hypothetical protein
MQVQRKEKAVEKPPCMSLPPSAQTGRSIGHQQHKLLQALPVVLEAQALARSNVCECNTVETHMASRILEMKSLEHVVLEPSSTLHTACSTVTPQCQLTPQGCPTVKPTKGVLLCERIGSL